MAQKVPFSAPAAIDGELSAVAVAQLLPLPGHLRQRSVLEFSLRLSRACLGKMIAFIH